MARVPAILALADGSIFNGLSIGAEGARSGEVVFNTALTGYQEILTDPSYAQQIVTLTYPHIGNTGCNAADEESRGIYATGLVIRDLPLMASNWRSESDLSSYLQARHVVAIAEDWCGDVVRHAPVLEGLAYFAPDMQVRYIRRADHKDVFAWFLTNGGEAIPKFVFLNDKFVECGNWGPMQEECRRLIARGKACGDLSAARRKVKELYDSDPNCMAVQRELLDLIEIATASTP